MWSVKCVPACAVTVMLAVVTAHRPAHACSCGPGPRSPFLAGRTQVLPANARGVMVREDPPPALEQFQLRDETAGVDVPVRVVPVAAHVAVSVTGLARVEPIQGFVPGHRYVLSRLPRTPAGTLAITVATEALDAGMLADVQVRAVGAAGPRLIQVPAGAVCSSAVVAEVQDVEYTLPAALAHFPDVVRIFTQVRTRGAETWTAWQYQASLCDRPGPGRSVVGFAKERLHGRCGAPDATDPRLQPGTVYEVAGVVAALEVDDRVHLTHAVVHAPPARDATACSEDAAWAALASADAEARRAQVCSVGRVVRGDDHAVTIQRLLPFARDADAATRACALNGLATPARGMQAATSPGHELAQQLVSVGVDALSPPSAPELVGPGAELLAALARNPSARDLVKDESAVNALARHVGDDAPFTVIAATAALAELGAAAATALEALLAATEDVGRAQAGHAWAMGRIAPRDPRVIKRLSAMASGPEGIQREAALQALAPVINEDKSLVKVFVAAARGDSVDAVTALGGATGNKAVVIPVLARIVNRGGTAEVRQAAMDALVRLDVPPVQLVPLLMKKVQGSRDADERANAVMHLGSLGKAGRGAIPALLGMAAGKPSDAEARAIMKVLPAIGASPLQVRGAALQLLRSPNEQVADAGARHLVEQQPPDGRVLAQVVRHPRDAVSLRGCRAAATLNAARLLNAAQLVDALALVIADSKRSEGARAMALSAASRLGRTTPALCKSLVSTGGMHGSASADRLKQACGGAR